MANRLYFCRRALIHLGRSPAVAGVTVVTVAVVFLILGIFALVGHNLSLLVDRLGEGLQLSVYLEDTCDRDQLAIIRARLESCESVSRIAYTGREEALRSFRRRLGPEASILEELGDNPVPASFRVAFHPAQRTPATIGSLAQRVVNLPGVEQVQYGQAWLDEFFRFVHTVRLLGLIIGSLILLAAMVIVSNTIRLSVYARRDEIQILKLVGATDGFIKAPFYFEGLLLGLLGAGLGTAFTWLLFFFLIPGEWMPAGPGRIRMAVEFLPHPGVVLMIFGGAFLGVFGTFTSLWRHLRV